MSNEQLLILLSSFYAQLKTALDLVEANLPEDLIEYKDPPPFSFIKEPVALYPVLDPLYEMLDMVDQSIIDLRKVYTVSHG